MTYEAAGHSTSQANGRWTCEREKVAKGLNLEHNHSCACITKYSNTHVSLRAGGGEICLPPGGNSTHPTALLNPEVFVYYYNNIMYDIQCHPQCTCTCTYMHIHVHVSCDII